MADETKDWSLIGLETEGGKRVYRIRTAIPKGVEKKDFAQGVIVEWRFADAGLPNKTVSAQMQAFEGHLDALDNHDGNSLLVHVYTGQGMREWCYYARDYDRYMRELNVALSGKPRFPIEILHQPDPTWKYWTKIREFATQAG